MKIPNDMGFDKDFLEWFFSVHIVTNRYDEFFKEGGKNE